MSQCHAAHPDGVPELEKRVEVGSGVVCDGGIELVVRNGRRGEFLACPEFPKCRVALDLKPSDESEIPEWDEKKNQRMQRCFKEHPEAAKRRTTRSWALAISNQYGTDTYIAITGLNFFTRIRGFSIGRSA